MKYTRHVDEYSQEYFVFEKNPNTRVYVQDHQIDDYILDLKDQEKRIETSYIDKDGERQYPYDYTRRIRVGEYGNSERTAVWYYQNELLEDLAFCYVSGKTLKERQILKETVQKKMDDFARKNPYIYNLMCVGGEPCYYVDDNGKKITPEEHQELTKKKFGDDVFEKAEKRLAKELEENEFLKKVHLALFKD